MITLTDDSIVPDHSEVAVAVMSWAISTSTITVVGAGRDWHVRVASFRLDVRVPWAVNRGCRCRIVNDRDSRLGVLRLVGKTNTAVVVGHG